MPALRLWLAALGKMVAKPVVSSDQVFELKLSVFNLLPHIRRFTTSFLLVVSLAFLGCVVMPGVEHTCEHVIRAPKPKSGFMVVGSDGKVSLRTGLLRAIPVIPFLDQPLTERFPLRWVEFQRVSLEVSSSPCPLKKVRGRAPPSPGLC